MAEETYPDELKYHPEHDWARIEGDEATFGITWYAQDALGEVVFYEPPEVGATIAKDAAYAEVESVKAVSDVIAPLSGEITAVNEALSDSPGEDQRGPLRRRLAGEGEAQRPGRGRRAARRRRLPAICSPATDPGRLEGSLLTTATRRERVCRNHRSGGRMRATRFECLGNDPQGCIR